MRYHRSELLMRTFQNVAQPTRIVRRKLRTSKECRPCEQPNLPRTFILTARSEPKIVLLSFDFISPQQITPTVQQKGGFRRDCLFTQNEDEGAPRWRVHLNETICNFKHFCEIREEKRYPRFKPSETLPVQSIECTRTDVIRQ